MLRQIDEVIDLTNETTEGVTFRERTVSLPAVPSISANEETLRPPESKVLQQEPVAKDTPVDSLIVGSPTPQRGYSSSKDLPPNTNSRKRMRLDDSPSARGSVETSPQLSKRRTQKMSKSHVSITSDEPGNEEVANGGETSMHDVKARPVTDIKLNKRRPEKADQKHTIHLADSQPLDPAARPKGPILQPSPSSLRTLLPMTQDLQDPSQAESIAQFSSPTGSPSRKAGASHDPRNAIGEFDLRNQRVGTPEDQRSGETIDETPTGMIRRQVGGETMYVTITASQIVEESPSRVEESEASGSASHVPKSPTKDADITPELDAELEVLQDSPPGVVVSEAVEQGDIHEKGPKVRVKTPWGRKRPATSDDEFVGEVERDSVIKDLESLITELKGKLTALSEDNLFIRVQYNKASTAAVEALQNSDKLEEQNKMLRRQIETAMRQRDLHDQAFKQSWIDENTQLRITKDLLLAQARATDLVRHRAAKYEQMKQSHDGVMAAEEEAAERVRKLEMRNEQLVDHNTYLRAKLMGVMDEPEPDEVESGSDLTDDHDDYDSNDSAAGRDPEELSYSRAIVPEAIARSSPPQKLGEGPATVFDGTQLQEQPSDIDVPAPNGPVSQMDDDDLFFECKWVTSPAGDKSMNACDHIFRTREVSSSRRAGHC